jgi:hypothetical protein
MMDDRIWRHFFRKHLSNMVKWGMIENGWVAFFSAQKHDLAKSLLVRTFVLQRLIFQGFICCAINIIDHDVETKSIVRWERCSSGGYRACVVDLSNRRCVTTRVIVCRRQLIASSHQSVKISIRHTFTHSPKIRQRTSMHLQSNMPTYVRLKMTTYPVVVWLPRRHDTEVYPLYCIYDNGIIFGIGRHVGGLQHMDT